MFSPLISYLSINKKICILGRNLVIVRSILLYCFKNNFSCNVSISGTFTMKHYLAYKNEINKFAFKHSS